MDEKVFSQKLILDGGFGGLILQRSGAPIGTLPEKLNLTHPDLVRNLHAEYVAAGSQAVYANTFGANRFKYDAAELQSVIRAGLALAREGGAQYVGLDIGSLGKLIGAGGISRQEAYDAFAEIVDIGKDLADFVVVETMTSLAEIRTAVLAVKEHCDLPILASMSFDKEGKTFFGTSAECFALSVSALGVAAVGANCSVGPRDLVGVAQKLLSYTRLPVFIKPNAGLPKFVDGQTVYDLDASAYAEQMSELYAAGVKILGGCCGSTPQYIAAVAARLCGDAGARPAYLGAGAVCSASQVVTIDGCKVVGERLNPTGKPKLKDALRRGDTDYLLGIAVKQRQEGADILDVNVGLNGIDEKSAMVAAVEAVQQTVGLPLMPDSSDPAVLEAALRVYDGRAIINSVNGEEQSLRSVLPLAAKYGAAVVGLTLDGGIPETVEGRIAVADKIIARAAAFGIARDDVVIDALTLAESSKTGSAQVALGTVRALSQLGIKTNLGISNISFGMPNREDINAAFLQSAKEAGLTLAIIDPAKRAFVGSEAAHSFLRAEAGAIDAYMRQAEVSIVKSDVAEDLLTLREAILIGQQTVAAAVAEKLYVEKGATRVVAEDIVPALDEVGKLYEGGALFLPQLIASADAAKAAFSVLDDKTGGVALSQPSVRFVLCTVAGDIHDIGKNIVKSVVSNYGYRVIDLGKDVAIDKVVNAVKEHYPCVLGLSALMTTTARNMADTIAEVKKQFPDIKVVVGGAVITPEYAAEIGGVYCRDANDTVAKLSQIVKADKTLRQ